MKVIKIEKQKAKQFKFGDKVKIIKDGAWIPKGTTGIVQYTVEDGDVAVFTEDDDEYFSPQDLELLEPSSKGSEVVKNAEGQKFRVVTEESFEVGDIVTLTLDDGSDCPKFTRDSDGQKAWECYDNLEPLTDKAPETTVTLELSLEELRLVEASSWSASTDQLRSYFSRNRFPKLPLDNDYEFYTEIKEIRKEAE